LSDPAPVCAAGRSAPCRALVTAMLPRVALQEGEGELDTFDLPEPALGFCAGPTGEQVGLDLIEAAHHLGVDAEHRASDGPSTELTKALLGRCTGQRGVSNGADSVLRRSRSSLRVSVRICCHRVSWSSSADRRRSTDIAEVVRLRAARLVPVLRHQRSRSCPYDRHVNELASVNTKSRRNTMNDSTSTPSASTTTNGTRPSLGRTDPTLGSGTLPSSRARRISSISTTSRKRPIQRGRRWCSQQDESEFVDEPSNSRQPRSTRRSRRCGMLIV
jgi:hypothetical protein